MTNPNAPRTAPGGTFVGTIDNVPPVHADALARVTAIVNAKPDAAMLTEALGLDTIRTA